MQTHIKKIKEDPVSFGNKSFCQWGLVASESSVWMSQSYSEDKAIGPRSQENLSKCKTSLCLLITRSGLLKGVWDGGEGKGKESSSWLLIERNLPKSAEAGNVQFSSSLKAASCQSDAYEPAQLREDTCLDCLHRNPMTAARMLSQPLLAALNTVAHCFDFRYAFRFGPTFSCHHRSAQRDTEQPRLLSVSEPKFTCCKFYHGLTVCIY